MTKLRTTLCPLHTLLAACSSSPTTSVGADVPAVTRTDAATDADAASADARSDDVAAAIDVPAADVPVADAPGADVSPAVAALVAARPFHLAVPDGYDASHPAPLLVLLHGYGASGLLQDLYFHMTREANMRGVLYATPDGTMDASGMRFWNASDACCDFAHTGVDDVAYIDAIIADVSARYAVDPRRIYLLGHSNGAFMSHRMACDRAGEIAAIVALAGATFFDATRCAPSEPVSILDVHGTADAVIAYDGGVNVGVRYPGETTTMARWAGYDRCAATTSLDPSIDLDTGLAGAETLVAHHDGCTGVAVDLWTIVGGTHLPALGASWAPAVLDWLLAHPKPAH